MPYYCDLKKVLLFILATIIVLSVVRFVHREISVPLPIYKGVFGPCSFTPPPMVMVDCITYTVLYQNLFLNLIIYYILSCAIVWICGKVRSQILIISEHIKPKK